MSETGVINTPDQRLRVFVSSTLQELAAERRAVQDAVTRLRLVPVMFELGARPHPPRPVYRAYLAQSQVFAGISLYDLALSSQARGDLDGAAELLREGLSLAAEAGDEPTAAYYLEGLATIARLRNDPQRAACLLAAADAQPQTSGSGWLHAYVPRAPHDHSILAELRSRMGDAAYEQAAAHGRSLAGTRAMQYGLEDAQPGPERQETAA
jgi:hypothetical protein